MLTATYDPQFPLWLALRHSPGCKITVEVRFPTEGTIDRLTTHDLEAYKIFEPGMACERFQVSCEVSGEPNTECSIEISLEQHGYSLSKGIESGIIDIRGHWHFVFDVEVVSGTQRASSTALSDDGVFLGKRNRPPRSTGLSPLSPTPPDNAEYIIWYGTNRCRNDPDDASKGYSARREREKVHYGYCRVYIPKSHKIGSIGSPWWKRLLTLTDDRLKLLQMNEMETSVFWQSINGHLASVSKDERCAVIFLHGYNVSFEAAALRAAQIGFDLSIKGAMAFFSWPSQGALGGYPADEATIEASEEAIANFITDFASLCRAEAVHIIAHSMGNRALLNSATRIAAKARRRSRKFFGQLILAAADVDADTFCQRCVAYTEVAQRATLYVSARDRAVEASRWLHRFPRAGLVPPVLVAPGIDTINVTNVDLTALGHGYIAEARDVLHDMYELIVHGAPPERRFGLREQRTPSGESFWLVGG
jgi:esterase/lipase superfamily enzyme